MTWVLLVARMIHILGGIGWVGAVLTSVFFIEPTARALGLPGDRFLAHLITRRRLITAMTVAATSAVAAGAFLYWYDSDGLQLDWITTHTGLAFTAGAAAALFAFLLAGVFLKPGFERLAALVEEARDDRTLQIAAERLEARLRPISLTQALLLVLAAVAMATARYLP
jgi:uncharacterized membrane protein